MANSKFVPSRLFKFKSIDTEGYWKDIIAKNRIFFPSPDKFNDPFECKPRFIYDAPRDKKISQVSKHLAFMYHDKLPSRELFRFYYLWATQLVNNGIYDTKRRVNHENKVHNQIKTTNGLLSLTENSTNPLMWAYYADSHKGICIEFNTKLTGDIFNEAKKVTYQKKRMIYNYFEIDPFTLRQAVLFTKSDHWDKEQEWRIASTEPNIIREFHPNAIERIYLGVNCAPEIESEIKEILRKRKRKISLKKARLSNFDFDLEFDEIAY